VKLLGIAERMAQPVELANDALERRAFLAEILRALRIRPDVRRFELPVDLFEALALAVVVKGTPSGRRSVP
jgi:hypothetical protein